MVDSYFWDRWLWPEAEVLYFNVVLNKSSEWGVMPFLWYFYSALPRALLTGSIFAGLAVFCDKRSLLFLFPAVTFIFFYSFLPHKELRFIIYTVPLLNTAAALAINKLWTYRRGGWILVRLCIVAALTANLAVTGLLTAISSYNYPGGHAIAALHQLEVESANVSVHLDVHSCQTGVSRFCQEYAGWTYDKTEDLTDQELMENYTHLFISESRYSIRLKPFLEKFEVLAEIEGFDGLDIHPFRFPPVSVRLKPSILLLKKHYSL